MYDILQVSFHNYDQDNKSVKIKQYKGKFISKEYHTKQMCPKLSFHKTCQLE